MSEVSKIPGGSFLIRESSPEEIYSPEDFSSEQLMYAKTARDFVEREVLPVMDELEAKKEGLAEALMAKAGEMGLLMADVPEAYGGLGLDKPSSALITENIAGEYWDDPSQAIGKRVPNPGPDAHHLGSARPTYQL